MSRSSKCRVKVGERPNGAGITQTIYCNLPLDEKGNCMDHGKQK